MEEGSKGFVVKDKRIFGEGGDVRPEEEQAVKAEAPDFGPGQPEAAEGPEEDYLPEVNFYNFIVSLSTTALYHFGDFSDPGTDKAEKNLPAAKQLIDTISMLKDKTAGNLAADELNLIEGVLFELRMRYVKETS
ncbi:MAG: DUF1844 domain-containing protein [Syntrophales bacterium LBB04]|nr:DUF1844 domain-containing protein [Syntrophales bacterium LBB04]